MSKLIAAAILLLAAQAHADERRLELGASLGYSRWMEGGGASGFGIEARVGYKLPLGLMPEVRAGYRSWRPPQGGLSTSISDVPIHAGIRWNVPIGKILLAPAALFGLDFLKGAAAAINRGVTGGESHPGMCAGGSLDFTLSPAVRLGLTGGIGVIFADDADKYIDVIAAVTLLL